MGGGGEVGVSRISSDRILLGLKFSISGFLGGRKILASIFLGSLIQKSRDFFLDIQNNLKIRVSRLRSSSGNFYGLQIRHGIF